MMTRWQSHKQVSAFKIAAIQIAEMPKWQHNTCRGSADLYSNCGHCERCDWERRPHAEVGSALLTHEDGSSLRVVRAFMDKHEPQVGGYYVLYEDGYQSYSPAKAFEEGYTPVAP